MRYTFVLKKALAGFLPYSDLVFHTIVPPISNPACDAFFFKTR